LEEQTASDFASYFTKTKGNATRGKAMKTKPPPKPKLKPKTEPQSEPEGYQSSSSSSEPSLHALKCRDSDLEAPPKTKRYKAGKVMGFTDFCESQLEEITYLTELKSDEEEEENAEFETAEALCMLASMDPISNDT
jgi:hypothetical protein